MIDRIDSSIWYRVSMVMYTKSLWISMHPHVHDLTVKYFDTIPTATTLHITKHGMLLATSEVGDQF